MKIKIERGSWVVTLLIAASATAYYFFCFLPSRQALGAMEGELRTKRDFVAQSQTLPATLRFVEGELEATRQYNKKWLERAGVEAQLAALFGQINQSAKLAGVKTTRFDPDPPIRFEQFSQVSLVLACTGTFPQTFELLRRLESLPNLVWIENLQLKRVSETGQDVQCEIKLAIFASNSENSD
ncbi:MAG: type IV pilus inner membrane component PilO [Pirellulales bacterium]